jgi:hypothetical protein
MSAQRTIGVDVGGTKIAELGADAGVIGTALAGFEALDAACVPAVGR